MTISEANLIVVAVMLLLFFLAIIVPFSRGESAESTDISKAAPPADPSPLGWTGRLREAWLRALPPGKLLPDTQPAYVASWVYVFGVATLAALGVVILSGVVIAIGGVDWWHTSSVGHFANSLHPWTVELSWASW